MYAVIHTEEYREEYAGGYPPTICSVDVCKDLETAIRIANIRVKEVDSDSDEEDEDDYNDFFDEATEENMCATLAYGDEYFGFAIIEEIPDESQHL